MGSIRFKKVSTYGCLSNFTMCHIEFDRISYKSSEAAWQAQKCIHEADRKKFSNLSPSAAKKLGRQVKLRNDWEKVKYQLMIDVCYAKFSQNKDLADVLLSTGEAELIEDTSGWHDNIWGDCRCTKCRNVKGQNLLGKALMEVRERLRKETEAK